MDRYYDVILGLIPLALFGITAVLVASGYGVTTAAPVGASVSMLLMGHAMFVRAPVDAPREGTESAATPREEAGSETDSSPATPFETAD